VLEMADTPDINQPDNWIVYSAITVHMTTLKVSLVNLKKSSGSSIITMGKGKVEKFKILEI
jgi:hypothetical protein